MRIATNPQNPIISTALLQINVYELTDKHELGHESLAQAVAKFTDWSQWRVESVSAAHAWEAGFGISEMNSPWLTTVKIGVKVIASDLF